MSEARGFELIAAVQQLALCTDHASVIGVLRKAARALTSADGVTVVLKEGELCHYVAEDAIAPLWQGQRFPLDSCISGWSMRHRQQVVIPDIYADPRIPHDAYRPTFVRSLAMTPMGIREPFGALGAYWAREHRPDEAELRVLQALAAAAASATDNVRLVETLRAEARRKDEFLAMLAHELRNPLAPFATGLELIRLRTGDRLIAETGAMMQRQLAHLVRLVDGLVDVSRASRGVLELRKETVDLVQAVHAALETLHPFLDERGHRVELALPAQPVLVDGDAARLAQAVGNLVHNAAKFTHPGGRISVALEARGSDALLAVSDTGRGIPADKLEEIFEMFARLDAGSGALGGLGVGLSLARRVVELHGGRIEAASDGLGRGSRFVVTLPLGRARARAGAAPAPSALAAPGARRILVVDDNVDAALSLAMLLRSLGHSVQVAHDGAQALSLARGEPPEVAFLDIAMPGMDGHELARRLRREGIGARLIALTGYGDSGDRRRSREAGFDEHVVKPLDPARLEALLAVLRPAEPALSEAGPGA